MREALQCLSQDGYITIIPSKGFMIRQLNEKDMKDSIQIRCAIEGFCTTVIASQTDTKEGKELLRSLKMILDNMEEALNSDALKEGDGQKAYNIMIEHLMMPLKVHEKVREKKSEKK